MVKMKFLTREGLQCKIKILIAEDSKLNSEYTKNETKEKSKS